jgi:tRNA G18 (ribose-2'-O)-methylase SpoU
MRVSPVIPAEAGIQSAAVGTIHLARMALEPIVISSLDDPRVDVYRNVRDADLRGRVGIFMAESELVLRRLLKTPQRLHSMLLSPEKFERLRAALFDLPTRVPVYVAELTLIHEIAAFHVHRGVLAAGLRLRPEELSLDAALGHLRPPAHYRAKSATLVITEGMTNVDNMGAIFRNAAAFGVAGIVLDPSCCDPLYRKAIRVSMGHALSIPYAITADWPDDLNRLKTEWDMFIVGAESTPDSVPLWQLPRHNRIAIAFGSEGHGLSPATLARCDVVCAIPMSADVPSINVAVASAVFLYELKRART